MYVCVPVCVQIHTWIPWGCNYSGSELPDTGEGNQIQVLWKGGKHFNCLAISPSSMINFLRQESQDWRQSKKCDWLESMNRIWNLKTLGKGFKDKPAATAWSWIILVMAWEFFPQAENKWFEVSYKGHVFHQVAQTDPAGQVDPRSQRCQVFLMTSHSSHDDLSSFVVWTKIIHICNVLLFLFINSNKGCFGGWIGGLEVKSKGCTHRGPRLVANTHIAAHSGF